jgi:hypothetical protein
MTWTVCESFVWKPLDGSAQDFQVKLGTPEHEREREWSCAVEVDLDDRPHLIRGISSLQAQALALKFLRARLEAFAERGRIVFPEDGTDVDLDAMFGTTPNRA